jgi:hypothetical protein
VPGRHGNLQKQHMWCANLAPTSSAPSAKPPDHQRVRHTSGSSPFLIAFLRIDHWSDGNARGSACCPPGFEPWAQQGAQEFSSIKNTNVCYRLGWSRFF